MSENEQSAPEQAEEQVESAPQSVPHHEHPELHERFDRLDSALAGMSTSREEAAPPQPAEIEPPHDSEPIQEEVKTPVRRFGRMRHA